MSDEVTTKPNHIYGFCPICGKPGVNRERRPDGFDTCADGHAYRSSRTTTEPKTSKDQTVSGDDELARVKAERDEHKHSADNLVDIINKLWSDIILKHRPSYGDWEDPGQAYRHLVAEFNDLRKERDAQAEAVRVLMAAAHPDSSGRLVCSSDLTTHQIAEAQSRGRWFVLDGGIGFVLVPWKLTTDKDRAREHGWDDITPALPMAYTEDNPIARAAVEGKPT